MIGRILIILIALLVSVSGFRPYLAPSISLRISPLTKPHVAHSATHVAKSSTLMMSTSTSTLDSMPVPRKSVSAAWNMYLKTTAALTVMFPLWTVLFAGIALSKPSTFSWFSTKYFTASLATLMLSMGLTLTPDDFARVALQPSAVIINFIMCYGLCPLLGFALGNGFNLPMDLIAGIVLVGCINGGQASNLCTYIAKGDVALSVLMTTTTTLAGIFLTPLLCKFLLGAVVPVDAVGIAKSCLQVVLAPIILGMGMNKYLPKVVEKLLPATPVIGVVSTCVLVASAVAQCAPAISSAGWILQISMLLMHLLGGLAGYWLPKYLNFSETQCRTMAIEVAMKSSAFSFLLAKLHFRNYATRVPSAVSTVWMALVGASLGVMWRFIPVGDENTTKLKR